MGDSQHRKLDKFRRLMVEQNRRVIRVRRALPENRIARRDVRLRLLEAGHRVAAMAIGATQHDVG